MERTRTRSKTHTGSRTSKWDGATATKTMTTLSETTRDYVMKGDNHPFYSDKVYREGGLMSGEFGGSTGYIASDYPVTQQRGFSVNHRSLPSIDYGALAVELLSRTNPSRSSMESVVSAIELREVPGLVREAMDTALGRMFRRISKRAYRYLSRSAKLNLMIQFGILPIISDLQTTLQFQGLVDQRVRELRKLQTRGLRRTLLLREDETLFVQKGVYIESQVALVKRDITYKTKRTVKGHVRWTVSSPFAESERALRQKALKIVYGFHFDAKTIYELMPWSWLIDYFSNLGQFVALSRNSVGATHSLPTMIVTTETTVTTPATPPNDRGGIVTPINNRRITKERFSTAPQLAARVGFLSPQQLSILGSLSVLKARRLVN